MTSAEPTTHPCCSLSTAIRIAASRHAVELDRDTLAAALGYPWLICAVPDETNKNHWQLYARDAFITEACKLLGLTVRPIHPPKTTPGLWSATEFRQHFDLSYRPIIEHALENNQSVIAWRGWSNETAPTWGLINGKCETGVKLRGTPCTTDANTQPTPLDNPSVQVYIVESAENQSPSRESIATHLEQSAHRAISGELDESFAVVTGPAAIDLWIQAFATNQIDTTTCTAMLHSLKRSQQSLSRLLAQNIPSAAIKKSTETIAPILENRNEENPLPTLQQLRDHLVDLHETLTH